MAGRDRLLVPILANVVLLVIMGVQWMLPSAGPTPDSAGLAARRPRATQIPPLPEYAAILRAPIFAPDRRPGEAAASNATVGGSLSGYAALGAVTGPSVAAVVISGPGTGPRTVRRGEVVEGWRLVAVDRAKAVFQRNGVNHALIIGAPAEGLGMAAPTASPAAANP